MAITKEQVFVAADELGMEGKIQRWPLCARLLMKGG